MTKTTIITLALLIGATAVAAAYEACEPVYRLYRTSPVPGVPNLHVATFDTCERTGDPRPGATYNGTMCEIARNLFQSQPGVQVIFWCDRVQPPA